MEVLASPFRISRSGRLQTVTQGSDAHKAQQIAALVQTRRGELPLALTYGIPDPTFTEVSDTEIAAALTLFNPEVEISSIESYRTSDGKSVIDIDFVETDNAVT